MIVNLKQNRSQPVGPAVSISSFLFFCSISEIFAVKERMKTYVSIILVMGMIQLPQLNMYWSDNELFSCPWIRKRMSREEFYNYHRWFHGDVDLVESKLNNYFFICWAPKQNIAIDESIILFKGRFGGRQHIPTKPDSTGIKILGMADEAAYLLGFWAYQGKEVHERRRREGIRTDKLTF